MLIIDSTLILNTYITLCGGNLHYVLQKMNKKISKYNSYKLSENYFRNQNLIKK